MKTSDIRIRDPFVLPVPEEGCYYLYGTTDTTPWGEGTGFDTYRSRDLAEWEGPLPAFRPPLGFWATENFWAPEVHWYNDAWYMAASFKAPGRHRGVQLLRSSSPKGPFVPLGDGPVTPAGWDCLDGTLWQEPDGQPWMVFCHEWLQVRDGEVCRLPLAKDLSRATGAPQLMFRASEAPWSIPETGDVIQRPGKNYVTDGPWLHRTKTGVLLSLWSSYGKTGYALGVARSQSGTLAGPWRQQPRPLLEADGGHGMLFHTLDGRLMLAIHTPNTTPNERMRLMELDEHDDALRQKEDVHAQH